MRRRPPPKGCSDRPARHARLVSSGPVQFDAAQPDTQRKGLALPADMHQMVVPHGQLGGMAAQRGDHRSALLGEVEPGEAGILGPGGDLDQPDTGLAGDPAGELMGAQMIGVAIATTPVIAHQDAGFDGLHQGQQIGIGLVRIGRGEGVGIGGLDRAGCACLPKKSCL